ncbi:HsdM family class I SAM-dependent methyltransferase [Hufsiella ginkgonis]|uniref:site-specific DNA-methyltransferase (adenine-specific) n=1 Tax=Hufsiella ginkgonis TaxID=2695274 RepID=A0A7K1XTR4_9SPHI|nr:class I SAM-dependent DNA methyltransferase [Hufsiella ginkgonis]MXV14411.1 N-6 DNA methylase [Hufsiella ginkgonis]
MTDITFITQTKQLIDSLKSVCANYGLGNDGNEFKIITQMFLYKFINDKFSFEAKKQNPKLEKAGNFHEALKALNDDEFQFLTALIGAGVPKLKPEQMITHLYNNQNQPDFAVLFDATLQAISVDNADIFSVKSASGAKDKMFDQLSQFITDPSQRDAFCRALVNKLFEFSFERMFSEKYDFFATIFEYLIKDYNTDSGGKYAEYYTPHAVARIMAAIMVPEPVENVTCYDPSAGSGTLLMNIAHAIGEDNCTVYSEDISQKSSNMLRLNLVLNNLSRSIPNIIKTNTISEPYYLGRKFDYIVSNPPFKLDFSDFRETLEKDAYKERFFAGIPKVPNKETTKMPIYLLFIQHIMTSLSKMGKAAIVVPTGFITAQGGIEKRIREQMIEGKMLKGVVSMPSNIFASTGTNVSVIFLDREADSQNIVLIDASNLGTVVKENKNQRTVLESIEEERIVSVINSKESVEDFSVVLTTDLIREKNYSFSAGQYFNVTIEHVNITPTEFKQRINTYTETLNRLAFRSNQLDYEIKVQLNGLGYEN